MENEKDVCEIEVSRDEDVKRMIAQHPCYSKEAQHKFGRIHLAVAPKCNIQCNYCDRKFDCVNESRPGVTSEVLSPQAALEKTKQVLEAYPFIKVVGVAGPGDPLANDETFETLELIKKEFPDVTLCLSTNGLNLPDKMPELLRVGVTTLTVTMNAIDPEIEAQMISHECLKEAFPSEIKEEDGKFVTSYGVLSKITVWIEGKKLAVDTESDTSMTDDELILDSNKRFRDFLYAATGYTAKERLKQAKKEVSK